MATSIIKGVKHGEEKTVTVDGITIAYTEHSCGNVTMISGSITPSENKAVGFYTSATLDIVSKPPTSVVSVTGATISIDDRRPSNFVFLVKSGIMHVWGAFTANRSGAFCFTYINQ